VWEKEQNSTGHKKALLSEAFAHYGQEKTEVVSRRSKPRLPSVERRETGLRPGGRGGVETPWIEKSNTAHSSSKLGG